MNKLRILYRVSGVVSLLTFIIAITTAVSFASSQTRSIILNVSIVLIVFGINSFLEIIKWRHLPDAQSAKLASWLVILSPLVVLFAIFTTSGFLNLDPIFKSGLIVMGSYVASSILNIYYWYILKK